MLCFATITKTMNSLQFSLILFILVPHTISFGRCDDISFSICWMSKNDVLERRNGNIWLNDTALKSISKVGKVTSLTVSQAVENKLTLQYGGSVQAWTFRISPRTKFTEIRGQKKPTEQPTSATKGFLEMLSPSEVFACENGTLFFHQDENFFLAIGHTRRLPVKLESRTPSMLLVSWMLSGPAATSSHTVTLFHTELGSYSALSVDSTSNNHYRFTALESCSRYVACVETAGAHCFTCLSTITDPDAPKGFDVTSWNSSSISLAWDCPDNDKFSFFLLTIFYLGGEDHITDEVIFWPKDDNLVFTLSDLEPCSRVKFGLQTVCQAGIETRYSKMVLNEGNSAHSNIQALRQTSFGSDNYTLSWEVRNTSSISSFRVYHEGALQGSTLLTNFIVGGLLPCQQYQAMVEAVCGDGVLMSDQTLTTHTGSRGVSELTYRSIDSTALWTPHSSHQPALAFIYELSLENGTIIQSSRVNGSELRLPGLEEGTTYVLDVWEECAGHWESEHAHVYFEGTNSSLELLVRAVPRALDSSEELSDPISMYLTMVVPWSQPEELQEEGSEPRNKMEKIFKDKELLKDFSQPARVELSTIEPAIDPDETAVLFDTFDATNTKEDVPLLVEDQLEHIRSLNTENISIRDGVIHWDGPDLCGSFKQTLCDRNSLCINTLGSYTCVCRHGFYDGSSVFEPVATSHPVCNEKGLISRCLNKWATGGIAKPYLMSYFGGKVDVILNDGRCAVNESEMFYFFRTSRKASECGTERRVNNTHIDFQNTLTVTLTTEKIISRRDLKVVWKCVYPRHYIRNAQLSVDMEWLSSIFLVQVNSSVPLGLTMTLFTDGSYTDSYSDAVTKELEDTLFFQVALQTNHSFASDLLLQVESCWATEGTDPQEAVQGVFLQDGCAVDHTFHWLSVNGRSQTSRFSMQMFTMPRGLPLYIHCLTNICAHDEDCSKNCSSQQRVKRSASRERKRAAVVSAGPLLVNRTSAVPAVLGRSHDIDLHRGRFNRHSGSNCALSECDQSHHDLL
ncbi:uncharacterized protein LOC115028247 isoform X2 [Cottoperca gobio]|uniref:Uncharacterized protein LOC115028247 isoform X2 n=1 Tax=Cottoperca gobio TaxID=56716 RepID=A0A6J2S552_COTGO|nr:uncharacterized protein LOC115028247 isoform X2 [Cottoperca gobio]